MDNLLGLLRIKIKRGVNLAVRDVRSSDPYVVVKMGKQLSCQMTMVLQIRYSSTTLADTNVQRQKLKTRVINKDVNPEWNEDLTLSVSDPNLPVKLTVYDHDMFSMDDKMGDAEFEIKPFLDALKMNLDGLPCGTVISRVTPCRSNCLSEETKVVWQDNKVVQDMCLRLRNVECGEVELQLQWIDLPGSKRI